MPVGTIFDKKNVIDIFQDPIRFKIFTELFFTSEKTAKDLLNSLPINRSTLSHHLTKMVAEGVLKVRMNPTGRAIKYYSLDIPVHKLEARVKMNLNSEKEKLDALRLMIQQIGFELKMAHTLYETYSQSLLQQEDLSGVIFSDSNIQFNKGQQKHDLMNGGVFFTTKDHGTKFINDIGDLVSNFRKEVFDLNRGSEPVENDFAVVLGGFNLHQPVKIHSKKVIVKKKSSNLAPEG